MKETRGIVFSSELSGEDEDDGYRYGSNGGPSRRSLSKEPNSKNHDNNEGEIYTRADGKRVRRVKRSKSELPSKADNDDNGPERRVRRSNSSGAGSTGKGGSLTGRRSPGRQVKRSNSSHAASPGKEEDGEPRRGRNTKRSKSPHVRSSSKSGNTLSGFLEKEKSSSKLGASRSVGAAEGEIYTRADGKKGKHGF